MSTFQLMNKRRFYGPKMINNFELSLRRWFVWLGFGNDFFDSKKKNGLQVRFAEARKPPAAILFCAKNGHHHHHLKVVHTQNLAGSQERRDRSVRRFSQLACVTCRLVTYKWLYSL